jgi:hypothetical protein
VAQLPGHVPRPQRQQPVPGPAGDGLVDRLEPVRPRSGGAVGQRDQRRAWSGRARALSLIWWYDNASDARTQASLAEEAAQRALSANPENAEALSVLAYLDDSVHWEWERAQQRQLRAIALAPNDAEIANFAGDHFGARFDIENMLASGLRELFGIRRRNLAAWREQEGLRP